MSVPKLEGSVDSAIATLEGSIKSLEGEKAPLQKKLADMKKQYEDLMLATDEYLSMETQKTEAPSGLLRRIMPLSSMAGFHRISSRGSRAN